MSDFRTDDYGKVPTAPLLSSADFQRRSGRNRHPEPMPTGRPSGDRSPHDSSTSRQRKPPPPPSNRPPSISESGSFNDGGWGGPPAVGTRHFHFSSFQRADPQPSPYVAPALDETPKPKRIRNDSKVNTV